MQHPPRAALTLPHPHVHRTHLRLAPARRPPFQQFAVGHGEVRTGGARHGTGRDCPDVDAQESVRCRLRSPEFSLRSAASNFSTADSRRRRRRGAAAGIDGRSIDWSSTIRHWPAGETPGREVLAGVRVLAVLRGVTPVAQGHGETRIAGRFCQPRSPFEPACRRLVGVEPIPGSNGQGPEQHRIVGEESVVGRTNPGLERRLRELAIRCGDVGTGFDGNFCRRRATNVVTRQRRTPRVARRMPGEAGQGRSVFILSGAVRPRASFSCAAARPPARTILGRILLKSRE